MRALQFAVLALPALAAARPHAHKRKRACTTIPQVPEPIGAPQPDPSATQPAPSVPTPTPTPPTSGGNSSMVLTRGYPQGGIRGANLGSHFVIEPWMMEDKWVQMGGERCGGCQGCVGTEWDLVRKLGQDKANGVFKEHWDTFITKEDVQLMKQYNLNSMRIPIGPWIIEETVNDNEYYPRGGLEYLRRVCGWLADAGITVLIDIHAAYGGSTADNAFAGRCVNPPQFWGNDGNMRRQLDASEKLAEYIHSEPEHFRTVWGLEALNEPPMNGANTPGYADFMKKFVERVRGVEQRLGVAEKDRIQTVFMDYSWQYANPTNPAFAANGGSAYDKHTYHSFGEAGGPKMSGGRDVETHIKFACMGDGGSIEQDIKNFNDPVFRGEWWLVGANDKTPRFDDYETIKRWGDAQKLGFSPEGGQGGQGWFFWSWKIDADPNNGWTYMRSYKDAVKKGVLHEDASQYFYPNVCKDALRR